MSIAPEVKQDSQPAAVSHQDLEFAKRQLAEMRARLKRGTVLSVVLAGVVLILLSVYFYIGADAWAYVTEPKNMVDYGQKVIEDNLPELRKSIEKQVKEGAPGWAADLSKRLQGEIPGTRTKLEAYFNEQLEAKLEESDLVTEQEFRKFIAKHRAKLEKKFKELADKPKLADESMDEIMDALETELDVDLRTTANETLKALKAFKRNWRDMLAGGKLSDEQKLELRAWMLARRLVLEQTDPGRLTRPRPVYRAPPLPNKVAGKKTPGAKTAK